MMQVVKKWRIELFFPIENKSSVFFIHDNFYSNMLNKLSEIHYENVPSSIKIELIEGPKQEGVFHQ
jgi:hypothetical protein